MTVRAAILIDVDGPLNPNRWQSGFKGHRITVGRETYLVRLNPGHGKWLMALAEETHSDLMWATFWNDDANTHIAPRIGLPELEVVEIDDSLEDFNRPTSSRGVSEWKAACVVNWAASAGRPFVWFDDADDLQEIMAAQPLAGDHLIVPVPSRTGLAQGHIDTAQEWLLELATRD